MNCPHCRISGLWSVEKRLWTCLLCLREYGRYREPLTAKLRRDERQQKLPIGEQ